MSMSSPGTVDVLMATDLRFPGGTTASVAEEAQAQALAGYHTGLLHIPSPIQRPGVPFAPRMRTLVESGMADLILDGPVHAKVLVIRHPSVLTSMPSWLPHVSADRVVIVANQVPIDPRAHAPYYDVLANHRAARAFTSAEPVWAPIGPAVRAALERFGGAVPMLSADWTNIVDVDAWHTPRRHPPGERPVIGRHTRGHWSKWPADRETILEAYPDDPRYVVQVLGGTEAPRDVLGYLPTNWIDLPFNTVRPAEFLGTTDFVVYYHHPTMIEAFGRTVLEGAASGAVTVVDPLFRPTFGQAALYAAPREVRGVVDELSRDFDAYREQSDRAVAHVRANFSYEAHAARLAEIIGPPDRSALADPAALAEDGAPRTEPPRTAMPRTLIVDTGRGASVDAALVGTLPVTTGAAEPSPIVLLPAARAQDAPAGLVDVETLPQVAEELSSRERHRYLRARIRGILTAYHHVTQVVMVGPADHLADAVPPTVQLLGAERAAGTAGAGPRPEHPATDTPPEWRIERLSVPTAPEPKGRTVRQLAQRGVNLVRQRAPRSVIRLGLTSKRTGRIVRERTLGTLAPTGALILERTQIPRLPTPPSPISTRRPTALFVVTDEMVPIESSLRAIVRRAVLSNAFRPVVLAPVTWIEAAARAGVALETLVLHSPAAPETNPRGSEYLRRRIAEVIQAFQPAAAVTIESGVATPSMLLAQALDVAEELSSQRTASDGTN